MDKGPGTPLAITGPLGHRRYHMSARKVSISTSKFLAVVQKLGMSAKYKANSIKVWPANGTSKRSLDISTNKHSNTVEVILVGFEAKEGVVSHPKPPAKTVTQMIDFSVSEKLVLRAFFKAAKALCLSAAASTPVAAPAAPEAPASQPEAKVDAEIAAGEQALAVAMAG